MRILPREDSLSQNASPKESRARVQPAPRRAERASGVLWIDDDPQFIARARLLAEQLLMHLHAAKNLEQALEIMAFSGDSIQAAFLNIDRLNLDQLEARDAQRWLAGFRATPGTRRMPMAFLSTRDDLRTRVWAAHAGAQLFLKKPIDPTEFAQAIHQLVALRGAPNPRILILERDRVFLHTLCEYLHGHAVDVLVEDDATEILTHLQRSVPDAVLVDARMPGLNGLELCRVLRTMSRWQDLPVLIVGDDPGLGARLAAFQAGCDDFLTHQSDPAEILARVQTHIERARLMRQRADRDVLTGLLTRRAFLESLAARLSEVARNEQPLAFCLLDLDRFKRINDTHGHLAGDRVLARLGQLLQHRFRVEDLRARWGGEEVVVVMANEGIHSARMILERIRSEFAQLDFVGANGEVFRVSFSAGIAEFPAHGRDVESLFNSADRQLYAAKTAGRNCILRAPLIN